MSGGRRRFGRTVLAGALVATLVPRELLAASVRVEVQLGDPKVAVGEGVFVEVHVIVDGPAGRVSGPQWPVLEGVDIVQRGSNTSVSMSSVNGRVTRTRELHYRYVLMPSAPGRHELEVAVEVEGAVHKPATVPVLEVVGEAVAGQEAAAEEASGSRPTRADADVMVWPWIDRERLYVGQPAIFTYAVWERSDPEVSVRSMPTFEDFWAEDLPTQKVRIDAVSGTRYRVHDVLRRAVFPQKAGKLQIGGGEVLVQPRMGVDSLFGFGRRRRRNAEPPHVIAGRDVAVEVLPLPAEGQPAGFSVNNVGKFELAASVDKVRVDQGEALTLELSVEGEGHLRLVEPVWPEYEGLRAYDPKGEDPKLRIEGNRMTGSRKWSVLLVAERAGELTIPAHELSYFDPDKEVYAVTRTSPIEIEVVAKEGAGPKPEVAVPTASEDEDLLGLPLALDTLDRHDRRSSWLPHSAWRKAAIAIPSTFALAFAGMAVRRRLGPSAAALEALERRRRRSEGLEKARAAVASGESFYPALGELLHGAAVDLVGDEGQGLPRERLLELVRERGVDSAECEGLREMLDHCDAARFGAGAGDAEERRALLDRAEALLAGSAWRLA